MVDCTERTGGKENVDEDDYGYSNYNNDYDCIMLSPSGVKLMDGCELL